MVNGPNFPDSSEQRKLCSPLRLGDNEAVSSKRLHLQHSLVSLVKSPTFSWKNSLMLSPTWVFIECSSDCPSTIKVINLKGPNSSWANQLCGMELEMTWHDSVKTLFGCMSGRGLDQPVVEGHQYLNSLVAQNVCNYFWQSCKSSWSNIEPEQQVQCVNCRTCSCTWTAKNFLNWQWIGTCQYSFSRSKASSQAWGWSVSLTWKIVSMCKRRVWMDWFNLLKSTTQSLSLFGNCEGVWERDFWASFSHTPWSHKSKSIFFTFSDVLDFTGNILEEGWKFMAMKDLSSQFWCPGARRPNPMPF